MEIPLPDMLRDLRGEEWEAGLSKPRWRHGLAFYMWLATKPRLFARLSALANRVTRLLAGRRGALRRFPPAAGWMDSRDLPAPEGRTFRELWHERD